MQVFALCGSQTDRTLGAHHNEQRKANGMMEKWRAKRRKWRATSPETNVCRLKAPRAMQQARCKKNTVTP